MGYIKRRQSSSRDIKISPAESADQPLLDVATALDPTISDSILPPSSPDETPLQTPRTPSLTPFSLRDAYLPNLAIPHMPTLPKLAVPGLPNLQGLSDIHISFPNTRELSSGFKDAVKHRWEDRRSAFEGMGMGIGLGGLGIRRRAWQEVGQDVAEEVTEVRIEEVSLENQ